MGMMFGFASHRRQQLEAELRRMAEELPRLGVLRSYLTGDLADGIVHVESELAIVLVQETGEAFQRRPDFFTAHLRPRVGTHFIVYTPEEFERWQGDDPVLRAVLRTATGIGSG
jgi:hypothetical protein